MSQYSFSVENQSSWISDIYNNYLPFKKNGFIVEIGVGHTLKNVDNEIPKFYDNQERCGSNSADLIDLGWEAILIEPVKEYCDEVLISHQKNLERIKIVNLAASDVAEDVFLSMGDTLSKQSGQSLKYSWIGRKISTKKTTDILQENNCPNQFDILSIDVEGFELNVLRGFDFSKYIPSIIIVETNVIKPDQIEELLPIDYKKIKSDNLNTVWVKQN